MARVWVSPEGEVTSTALFQNHPEIAYDLAEKRGYKVEYIEDAPKLLLSNGWVRYSGGTVFQGGIGIEGQPKAIGDNWSLIRGFVDSDSLSLGLDAEVWFDIWGPTGACVPSWSGSEQSATSRPPACTASRA